MVEYTLTIDKLKTPTDANWVTNISGGYMDIKGRVYDFTKVKEAEKRPDGTFRDEVTDKNGYWKASAELTGLINPFTNPITNAVVKEIKIEASFTDTRGWGSQTPSKNYYEYITMSCIDKITERYKELYGVEIELSYIKVPEEKKDDKDAPVTELSLKYISHVGAEEVKKINFEVYENVGGNLTLLAEIKDFTAFEIDKTTKKISAKLLDIDERYYASNKLEKWLEKNRDKLPKDTKYVLGGYPLEEKKDITTETKPADNTVVDNKAVSLDGEFTFDVQQDNIFKGVNNQFKELEIIGVDEIKETPVDPGETVDETIDDEIDEEYLEEDFEGLEDSIFVVTGNKEDIIVDTEKLNAIKNNDPENPNPNLLTDEKYIISKDTDGNIKEIIKTAKKAGITNKFTIAAILAICKKECGFIPQNEISYRNTAAAVYNKKGKLIGGIKSIFSLFKKYTDAEVDVIKKDDKKFFDLVYGGNKETGKLKFGNAWDEGYKYRGRGFNQITFKGSDTNPMSGYKKYKVLTGIDLVSDPDLLNKVDVAATCLIEYMKSNISKAPTNIKNKYNFTDINSFKNLEDATGAIYHANAGFAKSYDEIIKDSTGGRAKSFKYVGPLYNTYLKDV